MPRVQTFDELNSIVSDDEYFEAYFRDMDLTRRQREEREDIAKDFDDLMFFIFALILLMVQTEALDLQNAQEQIYERYLQILRDKGVTIDDDAIRAARIFAESVPRTTAEEILSRMANEPVDGVNGEDGYGTSNRRAREVSASEANTVFNHEDYVNAVASGKTRKQWITILDGRERPTHRASAGQSVPITEPFAVGDSLLMYPHDQSLGASPQEIVNCRCSVRYF